MLAIGPCPDLFRDFTGHYYHTGLSTDSTPDPTSGYFYSHFFALFLSLLARLPLETAIRWWWVFQAVSYLLLFLPSFELGRKNHWIPCVYFGLILFSEPSITNLTWGQVSVFLTGCVLSSWACYRNGWRKSAAVLLGLAIAIKYYPALFLIYYLLKKEWRLVVECLVVTLCCLGLPVFVFGWQAKWDFFREVQDNIERGRVFIIGSKGSQYFATVASRYLRKLTPFDSSYRFMEWLGYGWFIGNLILLWIKRSWFRSRDDLALSLLFLSLPFLLETSWSHYFVYLPFCVMAIFLELRSIRGSGSEIAGHSGPSRLAPFRYVILFVAMVLPTIFFFRLLPSYNEYSLYGCVLWANMLLMMLIYSLLLFPSQDPPSAVTVGANSSVA